MFRGKRVDNGEWVYGDLIHHDGYVAIWDKNVSYVGDFEVIPESVGQYTGLKDKSANKIFEGDILKVNGLYPNRQNDKIVWEKERTGEVYYYNGAFFFGEWNICSTSEKAIEIIGNVFDNPELLEVE